MLFAWPIVCLVFFKTMKFENALIWSILGGYIILPVGMSVDLPGIPALDKTLIPSLFTFFICYFVQKNYSDKLYLNGKITFFLALPIVMTVVTFLLNGNPIFIGFKWLHGLTLYDGVSQAFATFIIISPFLLGRAFLSHDDGHILILKALALAGLIYILPILIEVRLSPQIHKWVYGFFPHSFAQQIRYGGFRPVVFLGHGLLVSVFIATALGALLVIFKQKIKFLRLPTLPLLLALCVALILCKTASGILYFFLFASTFYFFKPQNQIKVAMIIAIFIALFPLFRGNDLVPTDKIISEIGSFDPDRAISLSYRFNAEDLLVARANLKPWFGWGGWGRNLVFDEKYAKTETKVDGWWVIVFGQFGWIGYLGRVFLLVIPVYAMARLIKKKGKSGLQFADHSIALALLYIILLIDIIPNSSINPVTWLIAGALWGSYERHKKGLFSSSSPNGSVQPTLRSKEPLSEESRTWGVKRY